MAFGDLVKSLIVRFTVENFEETKLELDDIGARAEALKHELDMKATLDDKDVWAKLELLRIEFKSARDSGVKDFSEIALAVHAVGDEAEGVALKIAALQLEMQIAGAAGGGGGLLESLAGFSGAAGSGLPYAAAGAGLGIAGGGIISEVASILPALAAAGQGVVAFGALGYPTFMKIYDAVTGVAGASKGLDGPQKQIVKNIQSLESEFGKLSNAFAPALNPLMQTLTGKGGIISQILQDLPPFATAAAKAIGPLLTQFDNFLTSPGAQKFQDMMLKLEGPAITAIGQGIGKLGGAVGKFLEDLSNPASARILADVFTALADLVLTVGWVFKQVNDHVSEIISDFERMYDNISHYVDDAWQAVSHAFDNVMHAFDNVQHAGDVFSSDLANVLKRVAGDVQNWAGDVNTWLNKAVSWFEQLPGKIVSAVGNLGGLLVSAGRSLIDGLVSGIQSAVPGLSSVLHWVTSLIPSWKGPIEKDRMLLFPSGQAIMGGLMSGIGSQVPALHGQLSGITSGIAGAAGRGAGASGPVQIVIGPSSGGLDQVFRTWLKASIRSHGGNPNVIGF